MSAAIFVSAPPATVFRRGLNPARLALFTTLLGLVLMLGAGRGMADPAKISALLQTDRLFAILQQEGVAYGQDMATQMLGSDPEPAWVDGIRAIHDPARVMPIYQEVFAQALQGADQTAIERWLRSDLARRAISGELAARQEMLDSDAEDRAIADADAADQARSARLAAVRRVIAAGDLVDEGVLSGMNANLAFYRAMSAGGAFPEKLSEDEIASDVAGQEDSVRADVSAWTEGYLLRAYRKLRVRDIDAIAAFYRSAPGAALTRAQNLGFARVYELTSAQLGAALARRMSSADL